MGALTLAALFSLVLPALAAAPKKGGVYRGTVAGSVGQPVALYVSKTGRRFMYPSGATLVMQCSTGHRLRVSPNPLGVDIKNGKFSFMATDKENGPRPNTVMMTGRFSDNGKKVSGTVSYEGADDRWGPVTGHAQVHGEAWRREAVRRPLTRAPPGRRRECVLRGYESTEGAIRGAN